MHNKKLIGSFYTPKIIADFIVDYLSESFTYRKNLRVLEPSAGDGVFVNSISKHSSFNSKIELFDIVEREQIEIEKIKSFSTEPYSYHNQDFLSYQSSDFYDLIVGNPPYIKKSNLESRQIELCEDIHKFIDNNPVKNIWTSFLLKSIHLLADDGVLAFVLPSELLQVKFAEIIREYLSEQFQRIELFTFSDILFECKGQDTVLLIAFKNSDAKGQFYSHIDNVDQLSNRNFNLKTNPTLNKTGTKWSHHILLESELELLYGLQESMFKVDELCDSRPGIVTAANEFFIVDELTSESYDLKQFSLPIIQKGLYVNGSVVFRKKDYDAISEKGLPSKVLDFNEYKREDLSIYTDLYLSLGESLSYETRYKCSQRAQWFVVPNISVPSQAFFFKRCHQYPKLIKNSAGVLVTDSAYKVNARKGYNINSIVHSFYNTFTLIFAELSGRYYGGGVLELTPKEFQGLPIPYKQVTSKQFSEFCKKFEDKTSIDDVLQHNDKFILKDHLGLSNGEMNTLNTIYKKLLQKRFRSSNSSI